MAKGRIKFRDSDPGFKKAIRKIGTGKSVVKIGIFSKESGSELVLIASVHEFGTDKAGKNNSVIIPERSFLRSTVDENKQAIIRIIEKNKTAIVKGKKTKKQVLDEIGLFVVGEVQEKIAKGIDPANATSTVAAKGSSVPLIDTGRLRQSIIHIVEGEGII